ncbi:MAG: pyridoxamine kinase [Lachnospiraceae bacterium]|nr:pyridoxamine kinase [Lachnospiraceae bacterium]
MSLRKLALIHAFSGFGHSTMSVILPVVSAMGVQGCPLPTAIFSNHTGFPEWYKLDFTEHMVPYAEAWNRLELKFDGIYSGYLGSGAQCDAVLKLVKAHPEAIFFLDPVMGDHGRLYSAITPEHVAAMKKLVTYAQYILPNITEACILTDTTYKEAFSQEEICDIISKLHAMGPSHVVITGLHDSNMFTNYISELCDTNYPSDVVLPSGSDVRIKTITLPAAGNSRPGTGDIFGSVVVSGILKGQPLEQSVQKAARFVSDCIKISDENNLPVREGTCFELVLPSLLRQE